MTKFISILLFSFITLSSPAQDNSFQGKEDGKSIPPFERLIVTTGGDIYVHPSSTTTLQLKGGKNCVENIDAVVSSKVLRISSKDKYSDECRVEIHIGTPNFDEIQLSGGGTLLIEEGFSPIEVLKCSIKGGGNIEMASLSVGSLFAIVGGGGEITAQVETLLDGTIEGGGTIFYDGNPIVKSDISNGGTIRRK